MRKKRSPLVNVDDIMRRILPNTRRKRSSGDTGQADTEDDSTDESIDQHTAVTKCHKIIWMEMSFADISRIHREYSSTSVIRLLRRSQRAQNIAFSQMLISACQELYMYIRVCVFRTWRGSCHTPRQQQPMAGC